MQVFLGPWRWVEEQGFGPEGGYLAPPDGVRSALEIGSSLGLTESSPCLFVADDGARLASEYTALDDSARSRSALRSAFGRQPQGASLVQWLVDLLRSGDPDGLDRCKPSMPSRDLHLRLFLAGLAHEEAFRFGQHPHTNQVQSVLQRDFRTLATAELTRTGKADHSRRILDFWCEKYQLRKDDPAEWQRLVPTELRSEIAGPLRHATTITESFNKSDGSGWGPDLSWTARTGTLTTTSNQGTWSSTGTIQGEADTSLSSADHYTQASITSKTSVTTNGHGPVCRASGTGTLDQYLIRVMGATNNVLQLFRWVSNSAAQIGSNYSVSVSLPQLLRLSCDGDQISFSWDGSNVDTVTNNAVTSGVVVGIRASDSGPVGAVDNFEASDLAAPSTFTASAALTAAAQTLSGSAEHDPPVFSSTGTLTSSSQTLSGDATFAEVPPGDFYGTGELLTSAQSLSGSAEFDQPSFEATGTLAASSQTISGTAEFDAPIYEATGTLSIAPQTISGTAEFDAPIYEATGTLSASSQTISGSATFEEDVPNEFNATGNLVVSSQSISGSAEFDAPIYEAAGTLTTSSQTLSGTAIFAAEIFSAAGSLEASSQTITAAATFTPPARQAEGTLVASSQVLAGAAEFDAPIFEASGTLAASSQILSGVALFAEQGFIATGNLVVSSQTISGVVIVEEPEAPAVFRVFCLPGSSRTSYGASGSRRAPFRL